MEARLPQFRYVPILRWKEGEEGALSHLVQNQKSDVYPLIILMNGQYKDKKAAKKKPAVLAAVAFVDRIIACWGTQPFYLDASDIPTPANGSHPIAAIASVAHSRGGGADPSDEPRRSVWIRAGSPFDHSNPINRHRASRRAA
ncbi:beta family protein [Methylobacterium sp. Leaf99]|uniref:beta family protein n=1 Tax=Methylobacterium sp. Leaf99 TaxID=1736251 RepID=UPI0009EBBD71|nr:hypothetical protein [Methylobacterium sp. Leaf99]